MKRTLLILVEPTGEVKICYGKPEPMEEIEKDHLSVKGSEAFSVPIDGPEISIKALDVAWEIEDHVLRGNDEGPDGLQSILLKVVLLAARQSAHILPIVPTKN